MEIEFDPTKDATNRLRRNLPLAFGAAILTNQVAVLEDTRRDYGERRMIAFGRVNGRLYVCVYTMRGEVHRIISVRKASMREQWQWPPSE